MSYASIVRNLPSKLLQPNSIAVFASISIHAFLLGVALPRVAIFSQQEKQTTKPSVTLTELSPTEQTRLPEFFRSSTDTPPFPQTPLPQTPLLETSPFNQSLSSRLKPLPLPHSSSITSFFPDLSSVPLTRTPTSTIYWPIQPQNSSELPSLPPPPLIPIPRESIDDRQLEPTPQESVNEKPEEIAANSAIDSTPSSNSKLNAVRQQNLLAAVRQRSDRLKYDPTNTSNEEALKNYVDWLVVVKQLEPEQLAIAGTYSQDACIRKLEGTSIYGVLVDVGGKASDLHLIKSSGYPLLNQQAQEEIQSRSFDNQADRPKAYRVDVSFQYSQEICPSLKLSPVE